MSPNEHHWLEVALDAAAGRRSAGDPAPPAELAYAEALRAARRAGREAPSCPQAVLRRAQALFTERAVDRVLKLVFDSWRDAAPATRGPGRSRNLRYEAGDRALDVRVTRPMSGDVLLQVAALPAQPGLTVQLDVEGVRRRPRFDLDDRGAGQVRLPPGARAVAIWIGTRERLLMQITDIPLE